jgi:hypothetical protein
MDRPLKMAWTVLHVLFRFANDDCIVLTSKITFDADAPNRGQTKGEGA